LDKLMQRDAAKRVVLIAAVAAIALVLLALARSPGAGAAPQAESQTTRTTARRATSTTTTTTAPTTTTEASITTAVPPGGTAPNGGPLLVPGASDAPASKANDVKNNDNTGTIVALVISGLLLVALLLGVLTYWFWRNTRPEKVVAESPPDNLAGA
jgi:hypothetical protein